MSRFKFSLQRLLELRASHEQEVATRHARARAAADAARAGAEQLEAVRDAGRARVTEEARSTHHTAGLLQQMNYVLSQLDVHVTAAHEQAATAESAAARVHGELNVAHQDRRILDRLRERQLVEWRAAATQLDRMTMDAIALGRFGRSDAQREAQSETQTATPTPTPTQPTLGVSR